MTSSSASESTCRILYGSNGPVIRRRSSFGNARVLVPEDGWVADGPDRGRIAAEPSAPSPAGPSLGQTSRRDRLDRPSDRRDDCARGAGRARVCRRTGHAERARARPGRRTGPARRAATALAADPRQGSGAGRSGLAGRARIADAARQLIAGRSLPRIRRKGTTEKGYDLRLLLEDIAVDDATGPAPVLLRVRTRLHPELGAGRPEEVVAALAESVGVALEIAALARVGLVLGDAPPARERPTGFSRR